jgi:transposase
MQADAFNGYNDFYRDNQKPAPIFEAACWSHGRRKFFDLAKAGEPPIAAEAVRRIGAITMLEPGTLDVAFLTAVKSSSGKASAG